MVRYAAAGPRLADTAYCASAADAELILVCRVNASDVSAPSHGGV